MLFMVFLLFAPCAGAQKYIDPLLKQGIGYHDAREYGKAIEVYRQILRKDSTKVEALYEISLSLMASGAYEESIRYCDKLIDRDDKYAILAYNTKGSCLSYMGKNHDAINVFLEGIERYEDFPQLYYNLGLAYYANKEYFRAKLVFQKTLKLDPKHAGAHLNLGRTMIALNKRMEGLLGLYYFLLLEPASDRSEWAFSLIQELLSNEDPSESDYPEAEKKLLSLLKENEKEIKKKDTTFDLFMRDTRSVFTVLDEINETTDPAKATAWDNYVSFFKTLSLRGYTDPFCYYISTPLREEAENWHKKNKNKLTAFARWIAQQE